MSDLTFTDAEPVKRPHSGGKNANPNPYVDTKIVEQIALKTVDNKPVAKSHTVIHKDSAAVKTDRARIQRQLTAAGDLLNPPVTARVRFEDNNTMVQTKPGQPKSEQLGSKVTFWTVPKIVRKSKVAQTTDTNNTAEAPKDDK